MTRSGNFSNVYKAKLIKQNIRLGLMSYWYFFFQMDLQRDFVRMSR